MRKTKLFLVIFFIGLFSAYATLLKFKGLNGNSYVSSPYAIIFSDGDFFGWVNEKSPVSDSFFVLSDLEDSYEKLLEVKAPIILPSYSLAENEGKLSLKYKLENFVKHGGVIIVFAQQYGRHVEKIVPVPEGEELKVYGWRESESGYMGVLIDDLKHPVFSFAKSKILRIPHDGYFEKYPKWTKTLLRRLGDKKPVFIYYRYGKGYVFLTSIYPGQAWKLMRLTKDTILFTKDLLRFAKAPSYKIKSYKMKKNLRVKLKIKKSVVLNPSFKELLISSPSGKIIRKFYGNEFLDNTVKKDDYIFKEIIIHPDVAGIYTVYKRTKKPGDILSSVEELLSGRFAVANRKINKSLLCNLSGLPQDKLKAELRFDRREYYPGEKAVIMINFTKENPSSKSYFVFCNNGKYEVFKRAVVKKSGFLKFSIKVSDNPKYFCGIYGKNGRKIVYIEPSIRILKKDISVFLDKKVYEPGEKIIISFKARKRGKFTVWVLGNSKSVVGNEGKLEFKVPEKWNEWLNYASWKFEPEADDSTKYGKIRFEVLRVRVILKEAKIDRDIYNPEDVIKVYLRLKSSKDARLIRRTWIIKPSGNYYYEKSYCKCCRYTDEKIITVKKGINEINYSVGFKSNEGGEHRIRIAFLDSENNEVVNWIEKTFVVNLPQIIDFSAEKNEYKKIGEDVNFTVGCHGKGDAKLSVVVKVIHKPDKIIAEKNIHLDGFKKIKFSVKSSELIPGENRIEATLSGKGGVYSRKEIYLRYEPELCDYELEYVDRIRKSTPFDMDLKVHISNTGKRVCKGSELLIEIRKEDEEKPFKGEVKLSLKKKIPPLMPEEKKTLTIPLKLFGLRGDFDLICWINKDKKIVEYDERNNYSVSALSVPEIYLSVKKDSDDENMISVNLINNRGKELKGKLELFLTDDNDRVRRIMKKRVRLEDKQSLVIEMDLKKKKVKPGYYEIRAVLKFGNKKIEDTEYIHIKK